MTDQQRIAEIRARATYGLESYRKKYPANWRGAYILDGDRDTLWLLSQLAAKDAEIERLKAEANADYSEIADTMAGLMGEIERLREAQRWIPVTERLPEDDPTMKMHKESHMEFCSVLAVGVFRGCEYANPTVSMVNRIRLKKTGIEYIDREMKTEDWHWSAPFESVTHWQPLPAAPEEEREQGCEACSESRHILHAYLDELDEAIRVFIEGDTLYLRGEGWQTSRKIHACPMCGRKLDGGGQDARKGVADATALIESLQSQLAEKDAEIKRLNDESPAYKFYYCESEDSYLLGYRVGNFYYAHWHDGIGFVFDMSQYLPWGEHVVEPHTAWKEHTYPSEPKEIDSSEWFKGFLAQQLTASQRRERAAVEFIQHLDREYSHYISDRGFEQWRGPQEARKGSDSND